MSMPEISPRPGRRCVFGTDIAPALGGGNSFAVSATRGRYAHDKPDARGYASDGLRMASVDGDGRGGSAGNAERRSLRGAAERPLAGVRLERARPHPTG